MAFWFLFHPYRRTPTTVEELRLFLCLPLSSSPVSYFQHSSPDNGQLCCSSHSHIMTERAMDQQMCLDIRHLKWIYFLKNEHDAAHFTHNKPRQHILLAAHLAPAKPTGCLLFFLVRFSCPWTVVMSFIFILFHGKMCLLLLNYREYSIRLAVHFTCSCKRAHLKSTFLRNALFRVNPPEQWDYNG